MRVRPPSSHAHPSPVLTRAEAIRYLRIDEDHEAFEDAVRVLRRLVQQGKLVPLRYCKSQKFHLNDLDRFLAEELRAGNQQGGNQAKCNGRSTPARDDDPVEEIPLGGP